MKAIELTETAGPEVMHLREIPTPIPQESEVLIRVAVTGVNFIDLYVREGRYGNELPFTPGQEAAGTVVAVGKSVSHLRKVTGSHGAAFSEPTRSMPWRLPNGSYRFRLVSPSNRPPPPCCKA
jgi:NADPH:quinone reductase-like Zn-dependent oxidoreductase